MTISAYPRDEVAIETTVRRVALSLYTRCFDSTPSREIPYYYASFKLPLTRSYNILTLVLAEQVNFVQFIKQVNREEYRRYGNS